MVHAGIFSGQFQFGGEIMPLWQAYTPPPHEQQYTCETPTGQFDHLRFAVRRRNVPRRELMPVIFRWNFLTRSRRIQPWFQAAGGLIYTTHKFPPNFMSKTTRPRDRSSTAEQACGISRRRAACGIHYFLQPKRSIDLGVNGSAHFSASLGDRNPGVNASIQIQVGYTFWR